MSFLKNVGAGLAGVSRYLKSVMGEDSYEKYLAHHQQTACPTPAMSVKEFWRDKMDRQDANPEGRCC